MKVVCLLLLIVCVGCSRDNRYSEDNGTRRHYEYVGNPDDDAIIERPCFVYDLNCISNFFVKHAKCVIRNGPIPDPIFWSTSQVYFPHANVSASPVNGRMFGMNNSRIEEFYINKASNKIVFAIQISPIRLAVPNIFVRFFRNSREPITSVDTGEVIFRSISFTAIIPNIDDIQLDKAEVTAYIDDPAPAYIFGPGVSNDPDPVVAQGVAELFANLARSGQEEMLMESPMFVSTYIQYNICDFGLKVF